MSQKCHTDFNLLNKKVLTNNNTQFYENSRFIKEYLSKYFIFYNNCRIRTNDEMSPKQKDMKAFKHTFFIIFCIKKREIFGSFPVVYLDGCLVQY